MSFLTLKRTAILACAILATQSLSAADPAARAGARAVFNEATGTAILFGGTTSNDLGSGRNYALDETWEFDGTRWIRRYPENSPAGRSSHVMAYDSNRERIVLFGGTDGTKELTDTWVYEDRNWRQLPTPNAPAGRVLSAMAFDPLRDRAVLFGGLRLSDDKKTQIKMFDMWEFDGTTWTRIMETGPEVETPLLVWDDAKDKLYLLGHVADVATRMYEYDPSARAWNNIALDADRSKVPCISDSSVAFNTELQRIVVSGGVCIPADASKSSPTTEDIWSWDGENWSKLEVTNAAVRSTNAATFYDSVRKQLVIFGGFTAYTSTPRSTTAVHRDNVWHFVSDSSSPAARSLFGIASDPVNNVVWMIGGINDNDFLTDFWKFENGYWERVTAENGPDCASPNAAFDTDRARLVVVCADATVFEWDNAAWKKFAATDLKTRPVNRSFSAMVYDKNIKKTVLFGGMDLQADYQNKTWTWDGTTWTEVKPSNKNRAYARGLTAMWYDPILRRTVLYGGIGRKEREGRLERYNDMWSFDGSKWSEIKPSAVPPTRYGAQVATDLRSNKTILMGGLRLELDEKGINRQTYANDTWEWDGTTWRQLQPLTEAPRRENGGMAYDPAAGNIILFGGWSGFFHSDTWKFRDNIWTVFAE